MAKFFKITSIIILVISAIFFIAGAVTINEIGAASIMLVSLFGFLAGLSLFTVGDLLNRVTKLEDIVNMQSSNGKSKK